MNAVSSVTGIEGSRVNGITTVKFTRKLDTGKLVSTSYFDILLHCYFIHFRHSYLYHLRIGSAAGNINCL